jgi:hypothetical protein
MNLIEPIQGQRIAPGDVLAVVLPEPLTHVAMEHLHYDARKVGVKLLLLPPGSKVYVKEPKHVAPRSGT